MLQLTNKIRRPMFIKGRSKKIGVPPEIPIYTGDRPRTEKVRITIIDYDETQFQEKEANAIEDCFPFKDTPSVTWINIDGVHQVDIIEKIGKHFEIHPLIIEDIVNTEQRPKLDEFEKFIFIVLKMLYYKDDSTDMVAEQVSLIFGSNFVISLQEQEGDVFDPIRERIRNGVGRIRKMGPDYLAYSLIDAIVDNYYVILEKIGEKAEDLEEDLVINPKPRTLQHLYKLKNELSTLHKSVWPLRDIINRFNRVETPLISNVMDIYIRDLYDHTIQIIEAMESDRDMLSVMFDLYVSSVSNKLNEVMKVLTIIATIFIPLTFISSIYGMNFKYMPELEWQWGYLLVLLVMFTIGLAMVAHFRKKKWI